jgi:hypothetical protein
MIEVKVLVGLPGSGKSYYANTIVDAETTIIDDLNRNLTALEEFKNNPTSKLIITDPSASLSSPDKIKEKVIQWLGEDATVDIFAFENDLEACWANVVRRNDGRIISKPYMKSLSKFYDPAIFDKILPVYRP